MAKSCTEIQTQLEPERLNISEFEVMCEEGNIRAEWIAFRCVGYDGALCDAFSADEGRSSRSHVVEVPQGRENNLKRKSSVKEEDEDDDMSMKRLKRSDSLWIGMRSMVQMIMQQGNIDYSYLANPLLYLHTYYYIYNTSTILSSGTFRVLSFRLRNHHATTAKPRIMDSSEELVQVLTKALKDTQRRVKELEAQLSQQQELYSNAIEHHQVGRILASI